MQLNEIKKIIALLEESNLKKLHLRDGEFEIALEKETAHKHEHVHEAPRPGYVAKEEIKPVIEDGHFVESPMVGTFYAASSPDQPDFVKVGDKVTEGTVICIIEAMKVMNEVKAGKKGTIKQILVENAQPIEYGTKLFVIE